jgi:hypothetical protein
MSNLGDAVIALAIGAGGGFLLWRYFRDDKAGGARPPGRKSKSEDVAAPPPRTGGVCSLKLDATGLTADGKAVDVPTALAHCKAAGRADVIFAADGPAQIYVDLSQAFAKAGIPITVRRP